jgi:hypothetical protein
MEGGWDGFEVFIADRHSSTLHLDKMMRMTQPTHAHDF